MVELPKAIEEKLWKGEKLLASLRWERAIKSFAEDASTAEFATELQASYASKLVSELLLLDASWRQAQGSAKLSLASEVAILLPAPQPEHRRLHVVSIRELALHQLRAQGSEGGSLAQDIESGLLFFGPAEDFGGLCTIHSVVPGVLTLPHVACAGLERAVILVTGFQEPFYLRRRFGRFLHIDVLDEVRKVISHTAVHILD